MAEYYSAAVRSSDRFRDPVCLRDSHVVFASDAPFDPEAGPMYIRETIRILDEMDISDTTRQKIYQDNAVRLMGLKL
jgi:aminocarboxymuconate-semialdehyde decarboxylase